MKQIKGLAKVGNSTLVEDEEKNESNIFIGRRNKRLRHSEAGDIAEVTGKLTESLEKIVTAVSADVNHNEEIRNINERLKKAEQRTARSEQAMQDNFAIQNAKINKTMEGIDELKAMFRDTNRTK